MYSRRTLPSGRCRARTYSNNNNIHAGRTADNQLLSRARVPITAFAAVGTPPPLPVIENFANDASPLRGGNIIIINNDKKKNPKNVPIKLVPVLTLAPARRLRLAVVSAVPIRT